MATLTDCAEHLGIDHSTLSKIVRQGIVDRQDRGQYDVNAVRLQYLQHIRAKAAGNGSLELAAELARLAKEQADAKEMENAIERGELVRIDEIVKQFEAQLTNCRTKLLATPTKVAAEVHAAATVSEVQDIIEITIKEALSELVGYNKQASEDGATKAA